MAINSVNTTNFEAYCKKQSQGLPERSTSVEEMEKWIQAKKNIMRHPDCPMASRVGLQKEIKMLEGEIAKSELQEMLDRKELETSSKKLKERYNPTSDSFAPQKKEKYDKYEKNHGINGSLVIEDKRPEFLKKIFPNPVAY